MTKSYYADISICGKQITISMYESREDCNGRIYYARCDGIQSKQKKRVMDWAQDKPKQVRSMIETAVKSMKGGLYNA